MSTAKESLGYEGKVTVSSKKGNKILWTKSFHNQGGLPLFQFLCWCLKSDYSTANTYRPVKIKLFNFNSGISPASVRIDPTTYFENASEALSNYVYMSASPTVKTDKTTKYEKDYSCSVTFHFVVPASYITKDVCAVAIYGVGHTNDTSVSGIQGNGDYCAYYLFTSINSDLVEVFDPIEAEKLGQNVTLVIDWSMSFKNIDTVA